MVDVLNGFGHLKTPPAGPFRFIALDVETAGKTIGGICQIGLCFVSNTGAMQSYSVLIDPEEPFEQFNMNRPQFAGGSKVSMDGAYGKK